MVAQCPPSSSNSSVFRLLCKSLNSKSKLKQLTECRRMQKTRLLQLEGMPADFYASFQTNEPSRKNSEMSLSCYWRGY